MSEEKMSDDFEFPEFIEEKISYLDKLKNITEVAIYPQELVVLPYETMTLKVTDANFQQLLSDSKGDDAHLGIAPQLKGGGLPAIGSIGVGADVEEINPMLGKTHLVKIRGVVRFTIDEYIETDKPYPMARITFFEDDAKPKPGEKEFRSVLFEELRELMGEYNRNHGKYKHLENLADSLKEKHLEAYSFFFWIACFSSMPAELRETLLRSRSTANRTYVLNRQLERTLAKLDKIKPANLN